MADQRDVFIVADNILSPLGKTTAQNFARLCMGYSGVKHHHNPKISAQPFAASLFDENDTFLQDEESQYTKFEQLLIASIQNAMEGSRVSASDDRTILIISSTKGNISLLETEAINDALKKRIALTTSAQLVSGYFGFVNKPIVISNACISGVLGIITGMRLIQSGQYDYAVIAGADVISQFVLSGFESFRALSIELCKPFDANRTGLNLGEGAATMILSSQKHTDADIKVSGGAVSNDANHISGPSRTGEELGYAINKAIEQAGLDATEIDFISAHGTATLYNDEMEANAINFSNLQSVPVNSLKGYYGHTLGAAGIIESVISAQSLQHNRVLPTLGYTEQGVSKPVNVCAQILEHPLKNCLKTASGFGGCNAAVVFSK